MDIYRRIYETHFGKIPKGYHIHHKDGNHSNNNINNLQCLTPQEHYNIHYSQGDYGACFLMVSEGHLTLSTEERSQLAKKNHINRIERGDHPFLGGDVQKKTMLRLAKEGNHPSQREEIKESKLRKINQLVKDEKYHFQKEDFKQKISLIQKDLVLRGEHVLQREDTRKSNSERMKKQNNINVEKGTHPSQIKKICPHCNRSIDSLNFGRYHGEKCKERIKRSFVSLKI